MNLKTIEAPQLSSSQYGKGIEEIMLNINSNFNAIRNGGFNKGEQGDSVKVVSVNLTEHPEIIDNIKNVLIEEFEKNNNVPKDINKVNVFDYFKEPGNMTFIYKDNDDEPLSSLPYIFKDLRFEQMKFMENETMIGTFEKEVDWSCVIYYEDGKYKITQEFPTLYYDNGFKWKINGVKTGLYAQGPQGMKGESGNVKLVSVSLETGTSCRINYIYIGDNPIDTSIGGSHKEICEMYGISEGSTVIALLLNGTEIESYVCSVYELNGDMMVECFDNSYGGMSNLILSTVPISNSTIQKLWDEAISEE